MVFPGHFEDHILPDKIHVLNVSFLVDTLDRLRGGVAGNIAYNMALLQQPCRLAATVGTDFDDYRRVLESMGVDTSGIRVIDGELTASAFITTDRADNQITGFYPGAMGKAADIVMTDHLHDIVLGIVSPTATDAMRAHARQLADAGVAYVYDPGQQIISLSASSLSEGIEHARMLIANDYELAMISEKTALSRDDLIGGCRTVVVTFGELGSTIYDDFGSVEYKIPAVRARSVVDPTGAGDGYRAGLVSAMLSGLGWEDAGRVASLAATYVVEVKGTQSHSYSIERFSERFQQAFPERAEAIDRLANQNRDQAARSASVG